MTFEQAMSRYAELNAQMQSGRMSREEFVQAVNQLRLQDGSGNWWQIDPATGGWITWNGSAWMPASPPPPAPGVRQAASGLGGIPRPTGLPTSESVRDWVQSTMRELAERTLSRDQFMRESRETPIAQRSQRWWDTASIFGGALGGALWFLYSSIRASREGYDLITPLIMALIPILMVRFRAQIDQLLLPLQKYKQGVPPTTLAGAAVAAPVVVAILLYGIGLKQYEYLRASVVTGTLISHILVRTPQVPQQRS
jgi:hypothetical protein